MAVLRWAVLVALMSVPPSACGGDARATPLGPQSTSGGGPTGANPASVSITPTSATVPVDFTQRLTAVVADSRGDALGGGSATSWTTSDPGIALVDASGTVTGVAPGSATITASTLGVTGTSVVTVTPPPAAPALPDPASYPLMSQNSLGLLSALGWQTVDNSGGLLSVASGLLGLLSSTTNVLQFTYPAGFAGGAAPATEFFDMSPAKHFYSGISWEANANWQGHSSNVNKLAFVYMAQGGGDIAFEMYGPPGGPYQMLPVLELVGGDTRQHLAPNVANVPVTLGSWHRIEWQIEYNTTTNPANGLVRWWMDGQLLGQYTDVLFPSNGIGEYQLSPTWGGVGDVKTQTDYFWFSNAVLKGY